MARFSQMSVFSTPVFGLEELRKRWPWFIGLGILLIILGMAAVGSSALMTLATMEVIGWLLIISGLFQTAHTFSLRGWNGFFIELLSGILYTVLGFMIVANPGATAISLTLLIAMFLIIGGIFRIVVAIGDRFHNWFWLLFHGVVNVWLGLAIWKEWPLSGLWVIGLFVGIDLVFNGWSLLMLGLAAKNLPPAEAKE